MTINSGRAAPERHRSTTGAEVQLAARQPMFPRIQTSPRRDVGSAGGSGVGRRDRAEPRLDARRRTVLSTSPSRKPVRPKVEPGALQVAQLPRRTRLRQTGYVHGGTLAASPSNTPMHKRKPYKCSICGAEVPDLPMPVFQHQMSHVGVNPRQVETGACTLRPEGEPAVADPE